MEACVQNRVKSGSFQRAEFFEELFLGIDEVPRACGNVAFPLPMFAMTCNTMQCSTDIVGQPCSR